MLEGTMLFVVQVLNETPKDSSRQDGALHIVGVLSSILMKKDVYKNQLDTLFERFASFRTDCKLEIINSLPTLIME